MTIPLSEGDLFLIISSFPYFGYQFAHNPQSSRTYIKSTENKPEKMINKVLIRILLKVKIFFFTLLINSKLLVTHSLILYF